MNRLILLILANFFILPSLAFIGVLEPVPQPMNQINGYIVVCPPDDGIKERVLENVDIFFEKYNFDDDITDFVLGIEDFDDGNGGYGPCVTCGKDFEQRTFQQVMTDPRFDDFAKIVKLYPDYLGKTIFYNLSNFTSRNDGKTLSNCVFENDNYISGGLKIKVQGLKADSNSKNNQYFMLEKNADLAQYKLPYTSDSYDASDIYQARRILKNKVFSVSFDLGDDSSNRAGNNFLQLALKEDATKRTKLSCRNCSMQLMLSRFTQCNEELHNIGFCNASSLNPRYPQSYVNDAFSNYHLNAADTSVLEATPLDFYIHTVKLQKTGGAQATAEILFAGRLREKGYRGARVFGSLQLEQGQNLSEDSSEKYSLNIEEMSAEEQNYFKRGIGYTNTQLENVSAAGIAPKISWVTFGKNSSNYNLGLTDNGFDIYRNENVIAHVDSTVSEFTDTQLYSDPSLSAGIYTYAVIPVNASGEYFLPESWFSNNSEIEFVKVRKY